MLKPKGFTLIELIMVIVLATIFVISALWIFVVGLKTWDSGKTRSEIRQESNLALEILIRELGQASSITSAAASAITFKSDIDGDSSDETVTYSIIDSQLKRTVDTQEITLAPDISVFGLSYYDAGNNLMSLPADVATQDKRNTIRVVVISVTAASGDESFTMSNSVYVRNHPSP